MVDFVKKILKVITAVDSIEVGSLDIEGFILDIFPANGKCIFNISRLLLMIYDYFEEDINHSLIYNLIVNEDIKEAIEKYVLEYSMPLADKIDL